MLSFAHYSSRNGPNLKLNVIDYHWAVGGHCRFVVQMLKVLRAAGVQELQFVSHGYGLAQYRRLFRAEGMHVSCLDIAPRQSWLKGGFFGFSVPEKALQDCDVAWFPWIHRHRIPFDSAQTVVGSFHDGLWFSEPTVAKSDPASAREERETTRLWLKSHATIACSSRLWMRFLKENFVHRPEHLHAITLASNHAHAPGMRDREDDGRRPWIDAPFLLCPAEISSYKNHEVLFEAYKGAALGWPLVLTGTGSDFSDRRPFGYRMMRHAAVLAGLRAPHRGPTLRKLVTKLELDAGKRVIALGYLPDVDYNFIFERASCIVMPTLGEGGGSFPVEEALTRGIPVICSDIPVMREHMERIGAAVMWFDPLSSAELSARLTQLYNNYPSIKRAAIEQSASLRTRRWIDVAMDYAGLFRTVADQKIGASNHTAGCQLQAACNTRAEPQS